MTNNQLVVQKKAFNNMFNAMLPEIEKALPDHLTPERLVRLMNTAMSRTPNLFLCTKESILGALMTCSELGLEPGDQGHIYMIPFKNKGQHECTVIIGYKGLLQLLYRNPKVLSVNPRLVYENDDFKMTYGTNGGLHHAPALTGDKGELRGAYIHVNLKGGGDYYEYMTKEDIDKRRAQSRAGQSGPWKTHYEEMCLKTVIRHASKYLPMSVKHQAGLASDEAVVRWDPETSDKPEADHDYDMDVESQILDDGDFGEFPEGEGEDAK